MISNDNELQTTMKRIERFQNQIAHLHRTETNPANYHASASVFIAEIDRIQLAARKHLSLHSA
jgi:hypothetical protein